MTTEPNRELLADEQVRKITLGGKSWPVPKLAPKQNSVIAPLILKLVPQLLGCFVQVKDPGDDTKLINSLDFRRLGVALDETGMAELNTITFVALQRAHPLLAREEFDDMEMGIVEQIEAVITIARQTGLLSDKKPDRPQGQPAGEGAAPQSTTSQTGEP